MTEGNASPVACLISLSFTGKHYNLHTAHTPGACYTNCFNQYVMCTFKIEDLRKRKAFTELQCSREFKLRQFCLTGLTWQFAATLFKACKTDQTQYILRMNWSYSSGVLWNTCCCSGEFDENCRNCKNDEWLCWFHLKAVSILTMLLLFS